MDAQAVQALQQQLANQAAQIQAQAAQIAAVMQQQQQAPGPFALTPAQALQNVIDLTTTAGIKLHKQIVTPLATPFNGSVDKLTPFLAAVSDRAASSNWNAALLQVSNQDALNPAHHNLITQHRMVSLMNVRAHAAQYIGQPSRLAQDSSWMYEFLRESLTEDARTKISLLRDQYVVQGTPDGPCYLKVILTTFFVETNATDFYLRETLHNLPKKMETLKSDIAAFNLHVRTTVSELASGGGVSQDLIVYLFNSYEAVQDHAFSRWIARKREDYDDGTVPTPEALMTAAETKYNQLKQAGQWQAKSSEEKEIIALTAKLLDAEAKMAQFTKKGRNPTNKKRTPVENPDGTDTDKSVKPRRYPDWRYERKDGQDTIQRDGKTWYWCDKLKLWALHKPEDCRAADPEAKGGRAKDKTKESTKRTNASALAAARALVAVVNTDANDDDDDDDDE